MLFLKSIFLRNQFLISILLLLKLEKNIKKYIGESLIELLHGIKWVFFFFSSEFSNQNLLNLIIRHVKLIVNIFFVKYAASGFLYYFHDGLCNFEGNKFYNNFKIYIYIYIFVNAFVTKANTDKPINWWFSPKLVCFLENNPWILHYGS